MDSKTQRRPQDPDPQLERWAAQQLPTLLDLAVRDRASLAFHAAIARTNAPRRASAIYALALRSLRAGFVARRAAVIFGGRPPATFQPLLSQLVAAFRPQLPA